MFIFRMGMLLACCIVGAIAAFVGGAVTALSLQSGEIRVSSGTGSSAFGRVSSRLADPAGYWTDLTLFGIAPMVIGAVVAIWCYRRLTG